MSEDQVKMPETIWAMRIADDVPMKKERDGTWAEDRKKYLDEQQAVRYIRLDIAEQLARALDKNQTIFHQMNNAKHAFYDAIKEKK